MTHLRYIVLLSCLLHISLQRSTPQDTEYVAAVVEYQVSRDVEANRRNYISHIEQAARQNADIIVFPELTLTNGTTSLPVPINGLLKEYPIPALHPELYDDLLVAMSAAARDNQIYVLVNVRELMDCTRNDTGEYCPEEKQYVFNTNVVLDRNGTVIDRYRKINLFGEATHTPALRPDLGHFSTDFGVTFSHFICFDLMFQVPSVQSVQKLGVTDVLFSTMWFSELPYLTAVQIQEAYAYSLNINFIAAGANNVARGSAGSGIYSGRAGALVSIMPGVPTTRLLVSRVPKVPGQISGNYPGPIYDNPSDHDQLYLIVDPSLVSHVSRPLVQGFQEFTLVDKDVSCTFRVRLSVGQGEMLPHFRAVVQDGANTYSRRELGVAACLLVACKSDDFKTCGYRYKDTPANVEVQELEIEMTTYRNHYNATLQCDNIMYYPMSFRDSKFPLGPNNITFSDQKQNGVVFPQDGRRQHLVYTLMKPQKDLIAFGIWGRLFLRDVDHHKNVTEEDIQQFNNILDIIYSSSEESDNPRENIKNMSSAHENDLGHKDFVHHYRYRAAAFSGVRSFTGVATGGSRVCCIVACSGDTLDTCGRRFTSYEANRTARFEELSIVGTLPTAVRDLTVNADDFTVYPLAVDVSIMPLEPQDYAYSQSIQNNSTVHTYILNNADVELYSFALWGRVFATDGQEATPPVADNEESGVPDSSSIHMLNSILLMPILIISFRY